jgi:hypothetical protein
MSWIVLCLCFVVLLPACVAWLPRLPIVNAFRTRAVIPTVTAGVLGLPQVSNAAGLLEKSYARLKPYERLSTTPLFYVCNSGGNPYLQEDIQAGDPSQRIIVYFMSSEDASDYLNEMAQGSPQNINDFRVMTTSMDKIMTRIQTRKQSRKIGRYPMPTVYRIQPSSRQSENAETVASKAGKSQSGKDKGGATILTVPVFTAPGMAMIKSSGKVISPYYFAYEDLLDDWQELQQGRAEGEPAATRAPSGSPQVEVVDLSEVLVAANSDGGATSMTVGIVPPRREIELIKRYYRTKGNRREFERSKIMRSR